VHVRGISQKGVAAEPRFVIDGHLGRLNAGLRMLGLDCMYGANSPDTDLAESSVRENRILLSRDRRLLMRKAIVNGYLVRSPIPRAQLTEVVHRFSLKEWIRPFRRCMRCNELLLPAAKQAVEERLEPLTRLYYDEFSVCPSCHQIYWKGSHFERMQDTIHSLSRPNGQT
jgi:uncharacterized protein with PIN domain